MTTTAEDKQPLLDVRGTPQPRRRWRPPALVRAGAVGLVLGSAFGLVFGLLSLNRPVANALVFYVLCAATGAAVGSVTEAVRGVVRRAGSRSRGR